MSNVNEHNRASAALAFAMLLAGFAPCQNIVAQSAPTFTASATPFEAIEIRELGGMPFTLKRSNVRQIFLVEFVSNRQTGLVVDEVQLFDRSGAAVISWGTLLQPEDLARTPPLFTICRKTSSPIAGRYVLAFSVLAAKCDLDHIDVGDFESRCRNRFI